MENDKNDQEEIEKINIINEEIKTIEERTHNRFKAIDDKLNMLLVFNAGLILLISYVIPKPADVFYLNFLRSFLFILFIGINIASIICILLGMSLKSYSDIEVNDLNTNSFYENKKSDILHSFLTQRINTINSKRNTINSKQKKFNIAMILEIINVCICVIAIILNLI